MTQDISGFSSVVTIVADKTYPQGYVVTQFADDADPIDIPSIQIADKGMGLNGDMVAWSKANPILVNVSVIAGTPDDAALSRLLENNRVGQGKIGARDVITLTYVRPNATQTTFQLGIITDGPPATSVSSAGRFKTKTYSFAFQNKIGD